MHQQLDSAVGPVPSDSELVRRIRAGAAEAAEDALREFHQRHYAAVLAYARTCCGSAQAAAELTTEAIDDVLRAEPSGAAADADADGVWRGRLLEAVRRTATAWHRTSRSTELREDFPSWLAGPHPGDAEPEHSLGVVGLGPSAGASAEPGAARASRLSPSRIVLLAVAVTVLAGVALSVVPLHGSPHHDVVSDISPTGPGLVPLPVAPTADQSPAPSPTGSASGTPTAGPATPSAPLAATTVAATAATATSIQPTSASSPSPSLSSSPSSSPSATATTHTTALSTRTWTSSQNGWGPVQVNRSTDGHALTIHGTVYDQGLGAHAPSEVDYNLGGTCTTLSVDVGIDDEVGANGSVVFQIYRDGTEVADSGLMLVGQPAKHLTADLTGAAQLRLVVTDGGNGNNSDHSDWGGPLITCN
ncbi:DNA-directed RNA polymerase specialized sigma24 family protein [Kitasatospora sp. MAP12-15]|uniref:NPCBM/NEW2 domain-containing protein n=1 Tax=unclassified Kitasatospora TaxID=2633591 RepID=UPI0024735138|nr:NPCBM/NEW2 domain-containing protein [Kitasatospora sp. MAP12-44]MDH6109776.1 DNA-directed RNA polymerase specialized sigma24 family protein [Kitasatospora sp. MAP12-44]